MWAFWYIFPRFGMLYQEKSGNPDPHMHELTQWIMNARFQFLAIKPSRQGLISITLLILHMYVELSKQYKLRVCMPLFHKVMYVCNLTYVSS
jgi:hypothetical protein